MNIWSAISSKKFFQALLDLLRTKDIPEVQMKLLGLIQKWGLNFEDKKNVLPNFFSVYNKLRMNNVQFPSDYESNYQQYISENNKNNNYEKNSYNENDYNKDEASEKDEDEEVFYYMDSLKNVLKVPNFEHKYRRLVNFLVKMHENIQMANLLIDNREHGGLKDIISTLREGNNTLIDTIQGGRLKDEKLMEITLGTTEDINQTLGRDEDIKNGYKPNKFKSYFVINNVIRIKNNPNNNNHRNRAKSTKPKKAVQRNNEKYGLDNYDKNKYKEKMGPKNVDDIFDLFSASNPSNEPQYFTNNNNINNNRGNNNNNLNNNINNFFNSSQTQQLRNNPMNNFFNNNNNNNNLNPNNNNRNNNNTMFFNPNMNNQQRPVMTNFDILEQKLNNLNNEQNQNNNYNMPPIMNNNQNQNMQFNQGFNNNNMNNNMNNRNNNNNLMNMLDQLGPGPQNNTNNNQLVPYIGSFNNQNNNNNNMNQNNNFMNNNNNFNSFGNNNNQYNNNNRNNMYSSQVINRGNNMNLNNNNNNRMNMSQNLGNNNNWMNQNNNMNNNMNNNQQMNFEEMQKQQRLKELDDLF